MYSKLLSCLLFLASGTALGYCSPSRKAVSLTIGEISIRNTSDLQGKFLFNLSQKVFKFLQSKSKVENSNNLIDGLQSVFKKYTLEADGGGFKDLCSKQIKNENDPQGTVIDGHGASRLCFMGKTIDDTKTNSQYTSEQIANFKFASYKGNLKHGKDNEPKKDSLGAEFKNGNPSNASLGERFVKNNEDITINNFQVKGNSGYPNAYAKEFPSRKLKKQSTDTPIKLEDFFAK